jgi:hypothetical protein
MKVKKFQEFIKEGEATNPGTVIVPPIAYKRNVRSRNYKKSKGVSYDDSYDQEDETGIRSPLESPNNSGNNGGIIN